MISDPIEHFCTLFDSNFLPMGLALHASLRKHHGSFRLWVICMDDKAESQLKALGLPEIVPIALRDMETDPLREVKKTRGRGEYCWTLTPFTFQAVFDRDASVRRVTYLDADLFCFDDPRILLRELDASGKHVLYTDHAYGPRYDQSSISGRYCVQFLCIANTPQGRKVMEWWQEKCLEWCYDRVEPGRFGDQKYLDQWERLFPQETHVAGQFSKTLAPWNAEHWFSQAKGFYHPVIYHFHSLRIVAPRKARLYTNYVLGPHAPRLYDEYLAELRKALDRMNAAGFETPCLPGIKRRIPLLSMIRKVYVQRNERYQSF